MNKNIAVAKARISSDSDYTPYARMLLKLSDLYEIQEDFEQAKLCDAKVEDLGDKVKLEEDHRVDIARRKIKCIEISGNRPRAIEEMKNLCFRLPPAWAIRTEAGRGCLQLGMYGYLMNMLVEEREEGREDQECMEWVKSKIDEIEDPFEQRRTRILSEIKANMREKKSKSKKKKKKKKAKASSSAAAQEVAECVICLLELEEEEEESTVTPLACGHAFHKDCISTWFSRCQAQGWPQACPYCRQ